jgi:hypothetical protein
MHPQVHTVLGKAVGEPALPGVRVAGDVPCDVHDIGSDGSGDRSHLLGHLPTPDDQPTAPLHQGRIEVTQGLGQEMSSVGPVERTGQDPVVQDEERNDPVGSREGSGEHGVVVDPQVPREERDRDAR